MKKTFRIADLFCGAGGTSTGAVEAAESKGYQVELTAVNHWPVAIDTHTVNHPGARHLCTGIDAINPRELFALAGAQGFRREHIFTGTKTDQVKQIGNAVPRRLVRALCAAAISQNPDVSALVEAEEEEREMVA